MTVKDGIKQIPLRIPVELYEKAVNCAAAEGRSFNNWVEQAINSASIKTARWVIDRVMDNNAIIGDVVQFERAPDGDRSEIILTGTKSPLILPEINIITTRTIACEVGLGPVDYPDLAKLILAGEPFVWTAPAE